MSDCMTFPDTVEEFMKQYKIVDTEQVYTNGTELVPIFRMKQWFKHLPSAQPEMIRCKDCKHNSNTGGNYTNCDTLPQMFGRNPEDNYCSYAERREE